MIEYLIRAATCRVSSGTESGTGWLIAKDLVITARHCVLPAISEGKPIELFFLDTGDNCVASKIVAQSEEWDACLLSLETTTAAEPLPLRLNLPREGETWQTFCYPQGKVTLGHRLSGNVAQVLEIPKLKIDLDLSIDPIVALQDYRGLSGAPLVCEGVVLGMIRLKLDGTIAALSLRQLEKFFTDNGVDLPNDSAAPAAPLLADWGDFPQAFAEAVRDRAGTYLFVEGAHGSGKSTFCEGFKADDKTLINLGAYHLSDPNSVLGADYRAQPQVLVDWLTTKVSGLIIGQSARKEEKSYSEQIRQIAQYLDAFSEYCAASRRQGMLFIDGLNEVPGDTLLGQLLGLLPPKLPPHVTIVFSAPNFANIAVALAGRVKTKDVFELPPLPDSACYRYCLQALKPDRKSAALVDRICEKAKGHPLYLRYLIEYANYQETDNDLNEFPILSGPIEEYYQGIWFKLLPDSGAVNLLALMTRLRWGVSLSDFAKILTPTEQSQFVSVLSRIRHLLADEESTAIYHASFAAFIIEQTAGIGEAVYRRLAQFCREQPTVRYCALNLVFHLSRASDNAVFSECTQAWVDTAVTLGVEPDALMADVDAVVDRAATEAPAEEFFRLMLLAQRISFRYDTLFAQSARLIAEALIVIARPGEALQHVLRLKTLLVGPDDAFKISFLLHQHGYDSEALTLLNRVQRLVVESYDSPMQLKDFLKLCSWHIQSVFLIRLSGGWSGMEQASKIIEMARRTCEEVFEVHPSKVDEYLGPILAGSATYFLTFRDEYADLQRLKEFQKAEGLPEVVVPPHYLRTQCIALLEFENTVDGYRLPKNRKALNRTFTDLAELISTGEIEAPLAAVVTDTLIRFGAPASIVELFAEKGKEAPQPIQIKAPNRVDVNHEDLKECLWAWRIAAFLDSKFVGPSAGIIAGTGWLESIEHLIGALYCCDGQARRAKADGDEGARIACRKRLKAQVIEPLRFTLQQRAAWTDSYAIPETALPPVYRQLAELLNDCFPEDLPEWLENLTATAEGQWGMYSEGFRASAFYVLEQLTRETPVGQLAPKLLGLLHSWRDHVLRGVENRHELVPEILRMIPIFAHLGAKEESERLYQRLLSVSMGPTWYKEDQLGIMTEVLESIAVTKEVGQRLPKVAGYLEKASGEMTFQRFVRAEKSGLLGQIARHGKFRAALAYFRRQCCGSTAELWAEAQHGPIDKVGPLKGNRFPGGALDDQAAILALVRNSKMVSWALRWALLEIFQCGDSRHLTDYAEAFAKIANEVGATSELVQRAEIVVKAETSSDDRSAFESAFRTELKSELHAAFETVLVDVPTVELPEPPTPAINRKIDDYDAEVALFTPGVFGSPHALPEGDTTIEEI